MSFPKNCVLPSDYFRNTRSDKTGIYTNYGDFYDAIITLLSNLKQRIRVLEIGCSACNPGSAHAFDAMPFVKSYLGIDRCFVDFELSDKSCYLGYRFYNKGK